MVTSPPILGYISYVIIVMPAVFVLPFCSTSAIIYFPIFGLLNKPVTPLVINYISKNIFSVSTPICLTIWAIKGMSDEMASLIVILWDIFIINYL